MCRGAWYCTTLTLTAHLQVKKLLAKPGLAASGQVPVLEGSGAQSFRLVESQQLLHFRISLFLLLLLHSTHATAAHAMQICGEAANVRSISRQV